MENFEQEIKEIESHIKMLSLIKVAQEEWPDCDIEINPNFQNIIRTRNDSEKLNEFIDDSLIYFMNNLWGDLKNEYKIAQYKEIEKDRNAFRVGIYKYEESLYVNIVYKHELGIAISYKENGGDFV